MLTPPPAGAPQDAAAGDVAGPFSGSGPFSGPGPAGPDAGAGLSPATLPGVLARAARQAPGQITYVGEDGSTSVQSYRDLCQEAESMLAGLRGLGLKPGDPVLLHLDGNDCYLAAFWACVLGGFIAAPVMGRAPAAGPGAARLRAAWELCGRPPVITGPNAPGRPGTGAMRMVTTTELRAAGCDPGAGTWHASGADDVFTILFTSGSTGRPKAAALTHRNVLTMIRGYTGLEGLTEREASFNWMPLDHAGGLLAFHLRDVYLGCHQVHASPAVILADPLSWLDWLSYYRATCTWAPNFAFSLINDQLAAGSPRNWDLSQLRHIMTAGEMIVPATVRKFLAVLARHGLPPTALHPSWGMSETSGGVTFSSSFHLEPAPGEGRFTDLGVIIPGASVRVAGPAGEVLPDGTPGRIQVAGLTVTPGYYRDPAANEAAFTTDGWFDTGDIGLLHEGRLTMTGRAKDLIIVNGLNYYCHEIEAVTEEVAGVAAACTAACAVRAGGDTEALAIFYCTELRGMPAMAEQWDAIRRHVTAVTGLSPRYLLPVDAAAIPRTETGKIRRERLRQLFEQDALGSARARGDELAAAAAAAASTPQPGQQDPAGGQPGGGGSAAGRPGRDGKEEETLIEIWRSVLGADRVRPHDDFFDLGGDSLAGTRVVSLASRAGMRFTLDDVLATRTVALLAAHVRGEDGAGGGDWLEVP